MKTSFDNSSDRLKLGLFVAVTFAAGLNLIVFIDQYAPILLIRDRWNSLNPIFHNASFWDGFTYKHGPHRMGLAYVFFAITTYLSDWNSRWDMFLQGTIYITTAFLALRLKFLIFKKFDWFDWLIPTLLISTQSALTVIVNPYVHGLIPLFAVGVSLAYFIKNTFYRYLTLSIVTGIAVFSGFSLVIAIVFLGIEGLTFLRKPDLKKGLILLLPSAALLFMTFTQGKSEVISFTQPVTYYLEYATLLTGTFLFVKPVTHWPIYALTGLVVLGTLLIPIFKKPTPEWEHYPRIIAILIGCSLFFVALSISGRADMGIGNALTTRYLPAIMPLMLGVYFMMLSTKKQILKYAMLIGLSVIMLRFQFMPTPARVSTVITTSQDVRDWERCLLENHSYDECETQLQTTLIPDIKKKGLQEKIDFLKANKLNIFKD